MRNRITGIYLLKFHEDGIYVGSSQDIHRRLRVHRRALIDGTHTNKRLQDAFLKYGDYKAVVLLQCCSNELLLYEQRAIDVLKPRYNISLLAGRIEVTPEHKAKLRASMTPERRAAISKVHKGKTISAAHREHLRHRLDDPERRAEFTARLRASWTPERREATGERLSVFHAGVNKTPEHRAKISAAHKGKLVTAETRAKLSAANMGKKLRPEVIAKMLASRKLYFERKAAGIA